jgi:hypothetical protein
MDNATDPGVVTAAVPASRGADAEQIWTGILDALEHDLARAEEAVAGRGDTEHSEWEIPVVAVPMPAALADRARRLAARQREVTGRLPAAVARTDQQLRATRHFASPSNRGAVYLDVSA